jgi:hypothetical protein
MPTGKGCFTKIGLYADVFAQKLWGFKSKLATRKNTVDNLQTISQVFVAPGTLMVDGGSHFYCNEVHEYCKSIRTKLHVVAAYAPWLNGLCLIPSHSRVLSEGGSKFGICTLLNALKRLCTPNLREDDHDHMTAKDILSNCPENLDTTIKNLNDHILPLLK